MNYSKVTLLVGHGPDADEWDCGRDQTFGLAYLHSPENNQFVMGHTRGFVSADQVESLKTRVFTEEGGI